MRSLLDDPKKTEQAISGITGTVSSIASRTIESYKIPDDTYSLMPRSSKLRATKLRGRLLGKKRNANN